MGCHSGLLGARQVARGTTEPHSRAHTEPDVLSPACVRPALQSKRSPAQPISGASKPRWLRAFADSAQRAAGCTGRAAQHTHTDGPSRHPAVRSTAAVPLLDSGRGLCGGHAPARSSARSFQVSTCVSAGGPLPRHRTRACAAFDTRRGEWRCNALMNSAPVCSWCAAC